MTVPVVVEMIELCSLIILILRFSYKFNLQFRVAPIMAPSTNSAAQQDYKVNEKVLCFHGELLYEAKIVDVKPVDATDKKGPSKYFVHYKGWKKR